MAKRLKKFIALPLSKKLLFFESLLFQLIAGLLLKIIPFKMIPRLFTNRSSLKSHISPLTPHASHLTPPALRLMDIKTATQTASHLSPWKNKCLVQSMAARLMLNRRKIQSQLSIGVTFDQNKKMIAHAWLEAGDLEVVAKNGNYLEIYYF